MHVVACLEWGLLAMVLQAYSSIPTFLVVHIVLKQVVAKWKHARVLHAFTTLVTLALALIQIPPWSGVILYLVALLALMVFNYFYHWDAWSVLHHKHLALALATAILLAQNALLSWCPFFRAYATFFYFLLAASTLHTATIRIKQIWDIAATLFNITLLVRVFLLLHVWETDAVWRTMIYSANLLTHLAQPADLPSPVLPVFHPPQPLSPSPPPPPSAPSTIPERYIPPPMVQMTPTSPPHQEKLQKLPAKRIMTSRF